MPDRTEQSRETPVGPQDAARERDLVLRAKHDREAFALLYREHVQAVADCVYRRVGDGHLAQDLVAEVFLRALRSLHRFEPRGVPFRHWLLRITTNLVNNWVTRHKEHLSTESVGELAAGERPAESAEPSTNHQLRRALADLPPRFQEVLTLHHIEGLRVDEVALLLGCREGTIKSRLARGRAALRHKLHCWGYEHGD